jgi:hypothetical protein
MKLSNRMNRISTVLMVLVAAGFATGCRTHYQQHAVSAEKGLDKIITPWEGHSSGSYGEHTTYTSYLVSDVHYGMASPLGPPVTTGETTAVVVKPFTSLNVIEFGDISTPTSTGNSTTSGVGRESWAGQFGPNKITAVNTNAVNHSIAAIRDAGNDSILGWGRWTDSRFINAGVVVPGCCSENKSAHYVFGAATPNDTIPASGTATFNLIAATSPTLTSGINAPGTLSNASQVGVSWGGASTDTKIGISLQGSFTAPGPVPVPFSVTTAGGAAAPLNGGLDYDQATRSFGGIITGGSVSGFIAGPQATHVGLTYQATVAGAITGIAQGAAAFKR